MHRLGLSALFLGVLPTIAFSAPPPSKYWDNPQVCQLVDAARSGNERRIGQLVKAGVDINAVGREGFVPLAYAMLSMNKKGFTALLKNGADPQILVSGLPGGDGSIAGLAAQADDLFWLEQLAAAKANLDIPALHSEKTPIYFAISYRRTENAKYLIDRGIDLEVTGAINQTPLQFAVIHSKYEIAHLLLEAGAKWDRIFFKDQTIVDVLRRYSGNPNILRRGEGWEWHKKFILLLQSKGCEIPTDLLAVAKNE